MILDTKSIDFSNKLIHWQSSHGRNDLPWQQDKTPYRVWVSEIMLQQTQVVTVSRYYDPFISKFPDVHSLAKADIQEVLAAWSGLGFYRRAQNLHQCAKIISQQYKGIFPKKEEQLKTLPGIGRSTAAAISSICFNQPAAILDGNVKRLLIRYFRLPTQEQTEKNLLKLAKSLVTNTNCGQYTQAMMDMGATICTKHQPKCINCPVKDTCISHKQGLINPVVITKIKQRKESYHYLIIEDKKRYLFILRGNNSIWANLWAPLEFITLKQLNSMVHPTKREKIKKTKHILSHIIMDITFWKCQLHDVIYPPEGTLKWHCQSDPIDFAIAKPFSQLFKEYLHA